MSRQWWRVGRSLVAVVVALVLIAQPLQVAAAPVTRLPFATATAAPLPSTAPAGVRLAPETVTVPVMDLQSRGAFIAQAEPAGTGLIVRFKGGGIATQMATQSLSTLGVEAASPLTRDGLQLMRLAPGMAVKDALAKLRQDPRVAYAEPNYELRAQTAPDDTFYGQQWGLGTDGGIWAEDAWTDALSALNGTVAAPVTVAVIDTGVDGGHEDLAGRVLSGHNAITGTSAPDNAADDSGNGHGTHVAGIIAARTNNLTGIAGAAGTFPVSILPVKVLDGNGIGTLYDVAQGIRWAAENGARVINLSLGARLPDYPVTLGDAVKYAQEHGVLVVAAAGNEGDNVEGFYPATLPGVVSVAASGPDHHPAHFSNYDTTVTAPGVNIISTLPDNGYGALSGTSMAAPFASATAALLFSVYPDKAAAEVAQALQNGHRDYPENWTDFGWRWGWANHYPVLDAAKALSELTQGSTPYDDLELLQPQREGHSRTAHAAGAVRVIVRANNPASVARVDFTITSRSTNSATVIGSVYGLAGGGTDESGIFELDWDSTTVPDGSYDLLVESFAAPDGTGAPGSYIGGDGITLIIANQFATGLSLHVLKPDGAAAAGALVEVYHRSAQDGWLENEPVWQGNADLAGNVIIPGAEATDGNDYLVLAQGTDPDFFYYRIVRAPAQVSLDATGAQHLTVTGRSVPNQQNPDGKPLVGAVLVADLLEGSLSDATDPSSLVTQFVLTSLGSDGAADTWVTPGRYNFRLVSAQDDYYLVQHDVAVSAPATSGAPAVLDFKPQAADVATLQLTPDVNAAFAGAAVLLSDAGDWFNGFLTSGDTASITVTPGLYSADIDALYQDAGAGEEWLWSLSAPTFQVAAAESHPLAFGPPLTAELSHFSWYPGSWVPGQNAFFALSLPDAHGNLTEYLGTQAYTPAGAAAPAAALGLPSGAVLHRTHAARKAADRPPAAPAPKSAPPQTFAYNTGTGRFEPVAQSFAPVQPTIEIRDAAGSLVATQESPFFDFAYWSVPAAQAVGAYTARVKLAAGLLGPSATGGLAETADLAFDVQFATPQPEPPVDLTVTVLDRQTPAEPAADARVTLLRRAGTAYFPVPDAETTTDGLGEARFSYLDLDPDGTYALAIYGQSLDPADPTAGAEPMFIFLPLASLSSGASVSVDASTYTMRRLVLKAEDASGAALGSGYLNYFAYGYDGDGAQGGALLENPDSDAGLAVWVPEGRYAFAADPPEDTWVSNPFHLIVGPINVPADVPMDGLSGDRVLVLGGAGLAGIAVSGPPAPDVGVPDYSVSAAAIFRSDMPAVPSPVFRDPGYLIYVVPGTYQVEAVLVRQHYDGEWDYWLEGELAAESLVAADPATPPEPTRLVVDADFRASITLDAADPAPYPLGSTVHSTHRVQDSHGNQLVSMATNLEMFGPSSLQAWRVRGAGPILTSAPGATGAVRPILSQNHMEIAPFLVIRDPSGVEVYRHKDAGPNFDDLWRWFGYYESRGLAASAVSPGSTMSTFFGDSYTIPEGSPGGQYTAALQLGAGPEGDISAEVHFDLSAAPAAPLLHSLPSPTNAASVTVMGSALAGATVAIGYSLDRAARVEVDSVQADSDGRFSLEVPLRAEGTYAFTATATMNNLTGEESAPVTVVIDRTRPGAPVDLAAKAPDQTHILLTWSAPSDTDVTLYRISRGGAQVGEVPVGGSLRFQDSGLQPDHEYPYEVIAVDAASNVSEPAAITARTGTEPDREPPSTPLNLRAVAAPQGVVSLEWDAAGDNVEVAGYHILRAVGDGSAAAIGMVKSGDPLTYTDTGLAASTTYTYTVTAFDAAGNESQASNPATATTPDLFITNLLWRAALTRDGLLLPGSAVTLVLTGEPGRQATAEVTSQTWYDEGGSLSGNLRTVTEAVTMTEDAALPGAYRGRFTLAAGTSELTSIQAELSDGQGHAVERAGYRLPVSVAGALKVTVVAPAVDSLNGARVVAWSASLRTGGQATLTGPGEYTLTGLAPASDYLVRIFGNNGTQFASKEGVLVPAGLDANVSLTPQLPGTLSVRVVDPAGAPVRGVFVQVNRLAGGLIGGATTGADGWTASPFNVISQVEVRAKARLFGNAAGLPYRDGAEVQVTSEPGAKTALLTLEDLPAGTLAGRVTDTSGQPLGGVVVTLTQSLDGRTFRRSGVSGEDGSYSIRALAGAAEVSAAKPNTHWVLAHPVSVVLPEGGTETLNVELDSEGPGTVSVKIYTRTPGGAWIGPMDMDWRVAVHFRLGATSSTGRNVSSYWSYPLQVWGRPGDTFTVQVDGREGGLPAATQSVQLGEDRNATATFYLEKYGPITALLREADGSPLSAAALAWGWRATLYSINASGQKEYRGAFSGRSAEVSIPVQAEGQYFVEITLATDERAARRTVTVSAEGLDLGEVRVSPKTSFLIGEVTATPTAAAPGSILTLRASFAPDAAHQAGTLSGARLALEIPGGTSLVPDSVTLNGQPAPAVMDNGAINVDLGDLTLSPGDRTVVVCQVRLDGNLAAAQLQVGARVNGDYGESQIEADLAPATVPLSQVSLRVPALLVSLNTTASGLAPADSTVQVFDASVLLGETQASPTGFWRLPVTLPDRGSPTRHNLRAVVDTGAGVISSPDFMTTYDADQVAMVEFSMQQSDGRRVTFDPSQGVASFPYVVVPGNSFSFSMRFNDPSRVSDVRILLGKGATGAIMPLAQSDGTMAANLGWPGYDLGPVYVQYKVKPKPAVLKRPAPTEEQLRQRLPVELSDFTLLASGGTPAAAGAGAPSSGWAEFSVPGRHGMTGRMDLTISHGVSYTPTDADLAEAAASGVPVYGTSFDYVAGANELTVTVSGSIPESYLDRANPAATATGLLLKSLAAQGVTRGPAAAATGGVRAAGAEVVVQIGAKLTLRVGAGEALNAADWTKSLIDGFGVPGKLDELQALKDQADQGCDPATAKIYDEWADKVAQDVMAGEAIKWGLQIAGVFLAPETFGLGTLVLFGASQAIGWAMDRSIDRRIQNIKDAIASNADCEKPKDKKEEVADPTWIWDPSGHVYEAVDNNRLEGVTTTVFQQAPDSPAWLTWDAAWFGQENPLVTDANGAYGWDVPPGNWQVLYEKPGYETGQSAVLAVPPPRTEVNVGLVSRAAPSVTNVTAVAGATGGDSGELGYIEVTFDKYMRAETLTGAAVTVSPEGQVDEFGDPVLLGGSLAPVGPLPDPNHAGVALARKFRFTPATSLVSGTAYVVSVSQMTQSYAERPMAADETRTVVAAAAPVPSEVSNVRVTPGDGRLTLTWNDPSAAGLDKVRVYWRPVGGAYGTPADVAKGVETYTINSLSNGIIYEIRLTTVATGGSESTGITVTGRPAAPTNPPSADGGTPPNPDQEQFNVGSGGQTITAFGGDVVFQISDGVFAPGSTLVVSRATDPTRPGDAGLRAVTPVYEFKASNSPKKPVTLSVRYGAQGLGGADPRKLGLYRQDDQDTTQWIYVGGVIDSTGRSVVVTLNHFSKYAVMANQVSFNDLTNHWSRADVEVLASRHVVGGVSPQEFQPDRTITRAELAKLLVEMVRRSRPDVQVIGGNIPTFTDVQTEAWYYAYIETAARLGLLKGDSGKARPEASVTREEMAVMLVRAMSLESKAPQAATQILPYSDAASVAAWAKGYVALARQLGLMQGVTQNAFEPQSSATRAQGAVVILRAMEQQGLILTPVTLTGTVRISEVEGVHLELEVTARGQTTRYVLLPVGGASGDLATRLNALAGKQVKVKGLLDGAAVSTYMRGPVLKVFDVTPLP
ncbi:MAG: S8 family serine peptidase [Symbiobacteriia bacterium]